MSNLITQVISKQDLTQADIEHLARRHFGRHQYASYGVSSRTNSNHVATAFVITDEAATLLYPVNVAENCVIRGNLFTYTHQQKAQEILTAIAEGQWHHKGLRQVLVRVHNRVMPLMPIFENNPSQMRFSMEDKVKLIANLVSMARNQLAYQAHLAQPNTVHFLYDIGTSFRTSKAVQLMVALAGGHVSLPIPYASGQPVFSTLPVCLARYATTVDNAQTGDVTVAILTVHMVDNRIEEEAITAPVTPDGLDSLPDILREWVATALTPDIFKTFLLEGIQSQDTPLSIITASNITRVYVMANKIYQRLWAGQEDYPDSFDAWTGHTLADYIHLVEKVNTTRTHRRRAFDQANKERNAKRRANPNRMVVDIAAE